MSASPTRMTLTGLVERLIVSACGVAGAGGVAPGGVGGLGGPSGKAVSSVPESRAARIGGFWVLTMPTIRRRGSMVRSPARVASIVTAAKEALIRGRSVTVLLV